MVVLAEQAGEIIGGLGADVVEVDGMTNTVHYRVDQGRVSNQLYREHENRQNNTKKEPTRVRG